MRSWLVVYAKGLCMGAADIVPGVSGGTIALIAGIYDRLVAAIAALDPRMLSHATALHTSDGREAFRDSLIEADVPFLIVLGLGIGTAFLTISRVISVLFAQYPAPLNGFFFGLIAASAIVLYRVVDVSTPGRIVVSVVGVVLAFLLSGLAAGGDGGPLPMVFLAGAIAISAMVLPGISGAAFLYILGQYEYMLAELTAFIDALVALPRGGSIDAAVTPGIPVAVFLTGAVLGLLTTARIVRWALARYRMATLGFLVGLMVGALRLPVEEASARTAVWTTELLVATVLAAVFGAAIVLVLEYYTDTLEY